MLFLFPGSFPVDDRGRAPGECADAALGPALGEAVVDARVDLGNGQEAGNTAWCAVRGEAGVVPVLCAAGQGKARRWCGAGARGGGTGPQPDAEVDVGEVGEHLRGVRAALVQGF